MGTLILSELAKRERTVHYLHRKLGGNRTLLYATVRGYGRATGPMREKIAAFFELPVEELFEANGMARKS